MMPPDPFDEIRAEHRAEQTGATFTETMSYGMGAPVFEEIQKVQEGLERRNPTGIVRRIIARDDILPPERAYRFWDTNGELTIYVNRWLMDTLPRRPGQSLRGAFAGYGFAIPVIYEEVGA